MCACAGAWLLGSKLSGWPSRRSGQRKCAGRVPREVENEQAMHGRSLIHLQCCATVPCQPSLGNSDAPAMALKTSRVHSMANAMPTVIITAQSATGQSEINISGTLAAC